MPRNYIRRRRFKRSYKKRTYKRKRRPVRNTQMTIIRSPSFMPDVLFTTLKYAETSTLDIISTTFFTESYLGNGIFDPSPFGNTSCLGFAELMGIYSMFQVVHASIEVKLINPSVTQAMDVALIPTNDNPTVNFDPMDYAMNMRGKGALLTAFSGSKDMVTLRSSATSRAMFGQAQSQGAFFGSASADPTSKWRWIISVRYPLSTTESIPIQVSIKYYTKFLRHDIIDPTLP